MTWMVGDDLESDIVGAQGIGMKTVLVRTGKFRPDAVERARTQPDGIVSSIAHLPGVDRGAPVIHVGTDLIEIARIRRSLERYESFRDRCFTRGRAGVLRLAAESGAELCGPLRRQGGGRQGARLRRRARVRLEGDRDRRPAEAVRASLGARRRLGGARRRAARSISR